MANGPAWHDRFPGLEFNLDADAFAGKDQVADYFEQYVRKFNLPVRTGIEVKKVQRNSDRPGFTIETNEGVIRANRVVAATGRSEAGDTGDCAKRRQPAPDPLGRLLQSRTTARRCSAGGGCRLVRRRSPKS